MSIQQVVSFCIMAGTCFGIPLVALLIMQKKGRRVIRPFVIGMAAFFISQILLRIPIMSIVLEPMVWYQILKKQPFLFCLFTGFTAGLFEEVARYVGIRFFLKNNRRPMDGLAFGLGHGGIEAMLLVGFPVCLTIASGMVDIAIGEVALSALERAAAIGLHIGETMIVLTGINKKQPFRYLIIAILIHTLTDFMVGFLPYQFNIRGIALELILVMIACMLLGYTVYCFHQNKTVTSKLS